MKNSIVRLVLFGIGAFLAGGCGNEDVKPVPPAETTAAPKVRPDEKSDDFVQSDMPAPLSIPVTEEELKAEKEMEARKWQVTRDDDEPGQPAWKLVPGRDHEFSDGIDPEDLKLIGSLRHLKQLYLFRTHFDDATLETIGMLESLEQFGGGGVFDVQGLEPLAKLKRLQKVQLDADQIDDAALEVLTQLPLLTLVITSNAVTDEGMKHVAKMRKLESLSISEGAITDAGLRELSALKKLKELKLLHRYDKSDISDAAVAEFRKAVPGCTVEVK